MPGPPEEEAQQVQQRAHLNQQVADIRAGLLKAAGVRARRIPNHIWDNVGREAMHIATEYADICEMHYGKTMNPYSAEKTAAATLDAASYGARHGQGPLAQYKSLFLDSFSIKVTLDPTIVYAFSQYTRFLKEVADEQAEQPDDDRSAPPGHHGLPRARDSSGIFGGYQQLPVEQPQKHNSH